MASIVLATLDAVADTLGQENLNGSANALIAVRAAVAELIDCAAIADMYVEGEADQEFVDRWRAALAAVRGAA